MVRPLCGAGAGGFAGLMALDAPLGLDLCIHLVPCLIVLLLLMVGWRGHTLGGWFFLAAGLAATVFFNTYRNPVCFLVVTGPFLLVGLLFLLGRRRR